MKALSQAILCHDPVADQASESCYIAERYGAVTARVTARVMVAWFAMQRKLCFSLGKDERWQDD